MGWKRGKWVVTPSVAEGQEMSTVTIQPESAGADVFPADPLDTWFVLRTKSRQEKILANELRSRGIANFLPIINCTKCGAVPVPDKDLPVLLPVDVEFDKSGGSPIKNPTKR